MWSSERIQKKDSFWRDIQIKCDYDNPILKVVEFIQKEFTCVLLILYTIHSIQSVSIGISPSGKAPDSESGILGSNPSIPAI